MHLNKLYNKAVIMSVKLIKVGRAYSEFVKRKIFGKITSGLLSHREASKKYGINRKSIGNWINQLSSLNLKPLEIAQSTKVDMKEDNKKRILAKQVLDLTKELENSNSGLVV
jgi:transposase